MASEKAGPALANVLYAIKDSIAYVTVNRAKVLNALNTPTWSDLRKAFEDARDDAAIRGVILTGAGDKAFIAGADISELAHLSGFEAEQSSRFGQGVLDLIENLGKPVVAAVNGFALGGGCETAMACSIRIAVERAKFGQPEVSLGLVPGGGGTQRLPRLVGKGRALQLILSGAAITFEAQATELQFLDRGQQLEGEFVAGPVLVDDRLNLSLHVGAHPLDGRQLLVGQHIDELIEVAVRRRQLQQLLRRCRCGRGGRRHSRRHT